MLVPAITSTGMRFSSSHLITPTWANPSAPPPSSTRPIRGRWLLDAGATASAGGWATPPGVSCAQRLEMSSIVMQTAKLQSFIAPPKRHESLRCHVSLQKEWGEGLAKNFPVLPRHLLFSCKSLHNRLCERALPGDLTLPWPVGDASLRQEWKRKC